MRFAGESINHYTSRVIDTNLIHFFFNVLVTFGVSFNTKNNNVPPFIDNDDAYHLTSDTDIRDKR